MSGKDDILSRLNVWASYTVGDLPPDAWGVALAADIKDAIAEITYLRSVAGAVSLGEEAYTHAAWCSSRGPITQAQYDETVRAFSDDKP